MDGARGPGVPVVAGALGWAVMIAAGVLHHELELGRPLGFWASAGIALPVALLVGRWSDDTDEQKDFMGIFLPTAAVLGWAAMIAGGVAFHEFGVGEALGYWHWAGLALPLAALAASLRAQDENRDFWGSLLWTAVALGWSLTIALGVVWHQFDALRPLGFWASAGLALPVAAIVAAARTRGAGSPAAAAA